MADEISVEAERAEAARSISYVFGRSVVPGEERDMRRQFEEKHRQQFGFVSPEKRIFITSETNVAVEECIRKLLKTKSFASSC